LISRHGAMTPRGDVDLTPRRHDAKRHKCGHAKVPRRPHRLARAPVLELLDVLGIDVSSIANGDRGWLISAAEAYGANRAIEMVMRSASEQDEIAHCVVGAGLKVHRRIGPGCFESAYTPCLAYEFSRCGLQFEADVWMDLLYEDMVIERAYQIDFIVAGTLVVEVKAVETNAPVHARQVLTYLKLTGLAVGLLMNFGSRLMSEGTERVANNFPFGTAPIGRRSLTQRGTVTLRPDTLK